MVEKRPRAIGLGFPPGKKLDFSTTTILNPRFTPYSQQSSLRGRTGVEFNVDRTDVSSPRGRRLRLSHAKVSNMPLFLGGARPKSVPTGKQYYHLRCGPS